MKKFFLMYAVCFFAIQLQAQKFKDLALTPPMGWNSWNTFQTKINEKLVMETADSMVSSGMYAAGFNYIVLDDGWMAMERNKDGDLVPDPVKFPNGMKVVADYVHAKGLKFGLYNCAGTKTCAGYPGTRGYEYQDARLYGAIGIDYLKFDWCSADGQNAKESYTTMSKALAVAGRPIIFSLCEWGSNKPWEWAAPVGQLWRTTGDISNCFDCLEDHGTWNQLGVMQIVEKQKDLRKFAGPDHWNDPDMLEVGNGLTAPENRSHFALWCMMSAPLMTGNDLRKMPEVVLNIFRNKEMIAIDQDKLGIQGFVYAAKDSMEVWVKPLENNELAICFLNRSIKPAPLVFDWKNYPIVDTLSKLHVDFSTTKYAIKNLYLKKDAGNTTKLFKQNLLPHESILLLLKKIV